MSHAHNPHNTFAWGAQPVPLWRASIILTSSLVVALTLGALASGVFLLLLPVFAISAVAYRIAGRGRETAPRREPDIIEGEFVVISDEPGNGETRPLDEKPKQR
jgi:hypothetical protein